MLPDGHLSLPEATAKLVGEVFEVILLPVNQADVYSFTERIAAEKGFSHYTEQDIERVIHESREENKTWRKYDMKIKVIIHETEEGGYWAEVPGIPGCVTQIAV